MNVNKRQRALVVITVAIALVTTGSGWSQQASRSPAGSCTPPDSFSLKVPLYPQETDVWCWNASGQMIMNFLGAAPPVKQCEAATKYIGGVAKCCDEPMDDACVTTGWPVFSEYGFTFKKTKDTPLAVDQLKGQIACQQKPIAFSWHWQLNGADNGGHLMVARGYFRTEKGEFVEVNNPWPPPNYDPGNPRGGDQGVVEYSDYVSGPDHRHWNDFYDVTKPRAGFSPLPKSPTRSKDVINRKQIRGVR